MQIDVARRKLLKTHAENGGMGFSWWRVCEDVSLTSYCESAQKFISRSAQQQVVSKEEVVDETVVDGEEDDEEELICLLKRSISVETFYAFLDYRLLKGNDDIVEGRTMQLARLDAWIGTMLQCL